MGGYFYQLLLPLLFIGLLGFDLTVSLNNHTTISLCSNDIYFEILLTTYHTEPVTALESYTFRSKINSKRDKTDLNKDILATCQEYAIVNCDNIADVIHARYDTFIEKLNKDEEEGVNRMTNCPQVEVVDLGYYSHLVSDRVLGKPTTSSTSTSTGTGTGITGIDILAGGVNNQGEFSLEESKSKLPPRASELLTVVSGYWHVSNKYTQEGNPFPHDEWLQNSLSLHMPYIFFTDSTLIHLIQKSRQNLPTLIVLRNITEFKTYTTYKSDWIHQEHVPNPLLANIWLEKMNLLYLASQISNSTMFAWVDAGLGTFRSIKMPSEEWSYDVLRSLPIMRLSYAHAHGTYHSFAAGVMLVHREMIPILYNLFYAEYQLCCEYIQDWHCGSEQYLFTQIRDKNPHLFHAFSYEYGDITALWANKYSLNKSKQ